MSINVLIVDDSAVMRAMIRKTLGMTNIEIGQVHQAADGKQGLELLRDNWIDLVIADINMPVMNGEQMIRKMREDLALRDIPMLVVSTEGSQTRIERLKRMGAHFIHKPFTAEQIRDALEILLSAGDNP